MTARALAAVSLGGAMGALLRWAVAVAMPVGSGFPWATVVVNLLGCFVLAALLASPAVTRSRWLPLLGPGLCGGFTTMSAYAEDARALLADGQLVLAAAYVLGTLVGCLLAVPLGRRVGDRVGGRS